MTKNLKKPAIRFKGFTEAWEQRELKEIVEYVSSNLTSANSQENGKYCLYDANDLIGKIDFQYIDEDYITVIKDGASVGRIRKLPKNTMFIGTMGALKAKKSDLDYIYALLSNYPLNQQFTGSTIPHIYFKDYGKNLYAFPKIEEQKYIGNLFAEFDNLITLHQRKLEKLKNIKKSLLNKMFV